LLFGKNDIIKKDKCVGGKRKVYRIDEEKRKVYPKGKGRGRNNHWLIH